MAGDGTFSMDAGMPENGKIVAAGGDAAWLWTCSIAYARRNHTDGVVPAAVVPRLTDRRQPGRLAKRLVDGRLWHEPGHSCDRCPQPLPGSYVIHDYPYHQGSVNGARAVKAAKQAGGAFGNHQRWHVSRGHFDPECEFCIASIAGGSHMRSDDQSESDAITDPLTDPEANRTTDRTSESLRSGQDHGALPFSPEITPPIVPPTGGAIRISDHSPGHGKAVRRRYDYGDDQDFLRFWATFPVRHGKPAAYKAWLAALARGAKPEDIISAAARYRDDPKRDPNHTKWPQGWLNDERYLDAYDAPGAENDDDFWSR